MRVQWGSQSWLPPSFQAAQARGIERFRKLLPSKVGASLDILRIAECSQYRFGGSALRRAAKWRLHAAVPPALADGAGVTQVGTEARSWVALAA